MVSARLGRRCGSMLRRNLAVQCVRTGPDRGRSPPFPEFSPASNRVQNGDVQLLALGSLGQRLLHYR